MKLQLNFQIVRFLNYKQRFSDSLPHSCQAIYRMSPNYQLRKYRLNFFNFLTSKKIQF